MGDPVRLARRQVAEMHTDLSVDECISSDIDGEMQPEAKSVF